VRERLDTLAAFAFSMTCSRADRIEMTRNREEAVTADGSRSA
jgi:hypothetical protein